MSNVSDQIADVVAARPTGSRTTNRLLSDTGHESGIGSDSDSGGSAFFCDCRPPASPTEESNPVTTHEPHCSQYNNAINRASGIDIYRKDIMIGLAEGYNNNNSDDAIVDCGVVYDVQSTFVYEEEDLKTPVARVAENFRLGQSYSFDADRRTPVLPSKNRNSGILTQNTPVFHSLDRQSKEQQSYRHHQFVNENRTPVPQLSAEKSNQVARCASTQPMTRPDFPSYTSSLSINAYSTPGRGREYNYDTAGSIGLLRGGRLSAPSTSPSPTGPIWIDERSRQKQRERQQQQLLAAADHSPSKYVFGSSPSSAAAAPAVRYNGDEHRHPRSETYTSQDSYEESTRPLMTGSSSQIQYTNSHLGHTMKQSPRDTSVCYTKRQSSYNDDQRTRHRYTDVSPVRQFISSPVSMATPVSRQLICASAERPRAPSSLSTGECIDDDDLSTPDMDYRPEDLRRKCELLLSRDFGMKTSSASSLQLHAASRREEDERAAAAARKQFSRTNNSRAPAPSKATLMSSSSSFASSHQPEINNESYKSVKFLLRRPEVVKNAEREPASRERTQLEKPSALSTRRQLSFDAAEREERVVETDAIKSGGTQRLIQFVANPAFENDQPATLPRPTLKASAPTPDFAVHAPLPGYVPTSESTREDAIRRSGQRGGNPSGNAEDSGRLAALRWSLMDRLRGDRSPRKTWTSNGLTKMNKAEEGQQKESAPVGVGLDGSAITVQSSPTKSPSGEKGSSPLVVRNLSLMESSGTPPSWGTDVPSTPTSAPPRPRSAMTLFGAVRSRFNRDAGSGNPGDSREVRTSGSPASCRKDTGINGGGSGRRYEKNSSFSSRVFNKKSTREKAATSPATRSDTAQLGSNTVASGQQASISFAVATTSPADVSMSGDTGSSTTSSSPPIATSSSSGSSSASGRRLPSLAIGLFGKPITVPENGDGLAAREQGVSHGSPRTKLTSPAVSHLVSDEQTSRVASPVPSVTGRTLKTFETFHGPIKSPVWTEDRIPGVKNFTAIMTDVDECRRDDNESDSEEVDGHKENPAVKADYVSDWSAAAASTNNKIPPPDKFLSLQHRKEFGLTTISSEAQKINFDMTSSQPPTEPSQQLPHRNKARSESCSVSRDSRHVYQRGTTSKHLAGMVTSTYVRQSSDVVTPMTSRDTDEVDDIYSSSLIDSKIRDYRGPSACDHAVADILELMDLIEHCLEEASDAEDTVSSASPRRRREHTITSNEFNETRDAFSAISKAFIGDCRLVVTSAARTRQALVCALNASMRTFAQIITRCRCMLSCLSAPADKAALVMRVRDLADAYRETIRAAWAVVGKPLDEVGTCGLLKANVSGLTSALSRLVQTLKKLDYKCLVRRF